MDIQMIDGMNQIRQVLANRSKTMYDKVRLHTEGESTSSSVENNSDKKRRNSIVEAFFLPPIAKTPKQLTSVSQLEHSAESTLSILSSYPPSRDSCSRPVKPAICLADQVPGRYFPPPSSHKGFRKSINYTADSGYVYKNNRRLVPIKPFRMTPPLTIPEEVKNKVCHTVPVKPFSSVAQRKAFWDSYESNTEVFTISFRDDENEEVYDPTSVLRSTYYTIKKVRVPSPPPPQATLQTKRGFNDCLTASSKTLHERQAV